MNMYIVWPVWFLTIILSFGTLEGYAILAGKQTLSRFVWELSVAFPPFQGIVMFIVGFLVCHFWWGGSMSFAPVGKAIGSWWGS